MYPKKDRGQTFGVVIAAVIIGVLLVFALLKILGAI